MTRALEVIDVRVGSGEREGGVGASDVHEARMAAASAKNAKPPRNISPASCLGTARRDGVLDCAQRQGRAVDPGV
ncbi:MAG: hypothetical protein M3Q23_05050 [Actinomycetota bacterium]|nr:hypothetical protein [Actinomycetota bacterium]